MFFTMNDSQYWYKIHGEGKPLVLLHGFTGSSRTWEAFLPEWRKRGSIITIDLPGHGQTRAKNKTMEACCQDLALLFNHLNLDKVRLLGYSMGGRTAIAFAMNYPEMVEALLLESTSPGLADLDERMQRKRSDDTLATKLEDNGLSWFVLYWENIRLFATQQELPTVIQDRVRNERLNQTEEGLANSLRYMGTGVQPSFWQSLEQFPRPVLLMAGALDQKYCQLMSEMQQLLPNSRMVIVPEAGHAIHVEKPDIFDRIVTGYLKEEYPTP